jgi:hypothetical protein
MRKCADSSYCGCRNALSYEKNYNQDDIDSYCSLTDDNGGKAGKNTRFFVKCLPIQSVERKPQTKICYRSNCI